MEERQSVNDMISRSAAIAQIKENYCDWCDHTDLCKSCETRDCIATIEQQVTAVDAAPVVHGYWKDNGNGTISCSRCATWFQKERKPYLLWCGYCGAKMDGGAIYEPRTGD